MDPHTQDDSGSMPMTFVLLLAMCVFVRFLMCRDCMGIKMAVYLADRVGFGGYPCGALAKFVY